MNRTSRFAKKPDMDTKRITISILKSVMIGYIITAIGVLLLTFIVYKFDLADSQINIGRIAVIILATIIMGLRIGRSIGKNKWMHGAIGGIIYFVIFVIVSVLINKNSAVSGDAISLFFMCLGGGTLGGMLG